MTAPPGPRPAHSPPRPTSLLKQLAAARLNSIPPSEFSIKQWLNTARDAFAVAEQKAVQADQHPAQPALAEEAYIEYYKAGQLMSKIGNHPGYKAAQKEKTNDYFAYQALKPLVMEATRKLSELSQVIDGRYAAYQHSRPSSSAPSSQPSPQPPAMQPELSLNTLIDGYTVDSPPTSPPTKQPTVPSHSGVASIANRLAALRPPGSVSSSQPSATRSSTSSHKPPPIPTKPDALSTNKTPPGSPAPRSQDLDMFDSWNGGAPPGDSRTSAGDRDAMGLDSSDRVDGSAGEAGQNGWSREQARRGKLASTPSTFGAAFPSVEDIDNMDWRSSPSPARSNVSLPSVPSGLPGSSNGSARPASTSSQASSHARPVELDAREFEREKNERAAAMAKLSGSPPVRQSNGLPPGAAYAPEGRMSAPTPPSRGPLPLAPPTAKGNFTMPHTDSVLPGALWQYFQQELARTGEGPRVLLLDVRPREEFERGCVKGEVVCLEPAAIRPEISSVKLEDGLSFAPRLEQARFAARHLYDLVVIYDRSSTEIPKHASYGNSTPAQQTLYHLYKAIYESEFNKNLIRQPVILIGGWDAWKAKVGEAGISRAVGSGASAQHVSGTGSGSGEEVGHVEAKRQNRKAAVVGGPTEAPLFKGGAGAGPGQGPGEGQYGAPVSQFGSHGAGASGMGSGYFGVQSSGTGYGGGQGKYAGVMSPSLAMPPTAAQRPGSAASYDAFSPGSTGPPAYASDYSNRPAYPQPQIHSYRPSASTSPHLPHAQLNGGHMTRTNGFSDLQQLGPSSQQSFSPRPSMEYPSLRKAPAPPPGSQPYTSGSGGSPARPPPPIVAPARPAPAAPAPLRSNSSFSLSLNGYNPAHSRSPIGLSFGDEAIGLTGLKNLGNTCYMNSTVQCLSATIPFAKFFKDGAFRAEINTTNPLGTKGHLARAVAELITALWMNNYLFLSPVTFRENICRFAEQFRGSDQHDAQEFLGFLLDGLHEDLNRIKAKPPPVEMGPEREHDLETLPPQVMSEREWRIYRRRDDSFVVDCFQGQFRNQLRCLTCGQTSTTYNTFMPLSVPVPAGRNLKVSLLNCIEAFVREEIMEKDEAWFCPRCKTKRKASKKLSLSRLPPILVIHLKRFSFKGPFSDKIETQVEYPLQGLDLTGFVPPPLMGQDGGRGAGQGPKGWVYDLYAVTNHYGNLSSGHYTAYVRSQSSWHHIGDSKVTAIDPSVLQTPQAGKSSYVLYLRLR